MTQVTRWWWIRHAPVDSGGKIYGQTDLDCDVSDLQLFRRLAMALPAEAVWVTSNLRRTRQTAEAILAHAAAEGPGRVTDLHVEPDFAEQHFGDWQGLSHDELARRRDGAWHRFWHAPAEEAPPGGESFADLVDRTGRTIERLNRRHAGGDIVAVTHGGTIRAALTVALGLHPERALGFAIENCSLTRLDHIEGPSGSHDESPSSWRVVAVNLSPRHLP